MHTSGLVITVVADPFEATRAMRELRTSGPLTVGASVGPTWAATLETDDAKTAHDWHDWASALPGVVGIEVVFVHWDESEMADA